MLRIYKLYILVLDSFRLRSLIWIDIVNLTAIPHKFKAGILIKRESKSDILSPVDVRQFAPVAEPAL